MSGPSTATVKCLKCLLSVFNTLLWAAGTIILALGIYLITQMNKYVEVDPGNRITPTVAYVFLGIGLAITLLGISACCCTFLEKSTGLYLYSTLLVVVFLVQLACGIAWFVFKSNLSDAYFQGLSNAVSHYEEGGDRAKFVDDLQQNLKCCGIANYTDWMKPPHVAVPLSCCINGTVTPCDTTKPTDIYTNGCYKITLDYLDITIKIIGGIALCLAFFSMLGFVLSCCLARQVNKLHEYQPL